MKRPQSSLRSRRTARTLTATQTATNSRNGYRNDICPVVAMGVYHMSATLRPVTTTGAREVTLKNRSRKRRGGGPSIRCLLAVKACYGRREHVSAR